MTEAPAIIVGLGNPGREHERDRHNVGYWLVDNLAAGTRFRSDQKLLGDTCQVSLDGQSLRLLKPTTYMNRSGQSVRRAMDYFKLAPEQLLVVHDELDLPPGIARFKRSGGHGGNNGLRDVISHCGPDFLRLRIGIGHPGRKNQVVSYVLKPPTAEQRALMLDALQVARRSLEILYADGLDKAMTFLHTATAREDITTDLGPAG